MLNEDEKGSEQDKQNHRVPENVSNLSKQLVHFIFN